MDGYQNTKETADPMSWRGTNTVDSPPSIQEANMTVDSRKTSELNSAQKKKLADLVRLSMGAYSIVQFAPICGLSVSFLSKALNMALSAKPSQRSLAKLAEASPVEGTSLKDFYEVCGYDTSAVADKIPKPALKEKIPLDQAITEYYSSPAILGVNTFLSAWMSQNNNPDINLRLFKEGKVFTVTTRNDDFSAICVVGYCQDNNGIERTKREILSRLLEALGIADREKLSGKVCFYLITDSRELFQFCSDELPKLPSQNMVVLLSDERHTGFCEEKRWLVGGQEEVHLPRLSYNDK